VTTTESIFTSRIAPGAVFADGRIVEYAVRRPVADCVALQILDLFEPGDERAVVVVSISGEVAKLSHAALRDLVDEFIYRRVAGAMRGTDEAAIEVPERIAEWPRGMTEADVAALNAAQQQLAREQAEAAKPKVRSLEEHRRSRRAS
jgi:hypothetical protein